MTEKDTLLNIIVYCEMARRGIARSDEMIERILDEVKPHCSKSLLESLGKNCVLTENPIAVK